MPDLLPYLIGGLANGALYGLLALGFVLVYRATSVVNFAIGEFLLVGAYLTYTFALFLPLPLAILAALPLAFLFGLLVERGFVRPLLGRSVVAVIMATIGLAAALDGGVQLVWGPDLKYLRGELPQLGFQLGDTFVPPRAVWNLVLALPLGFGLLWLLRKSRYGVLVRAISEREVAALALGIPTARILAGVWGISALLATLAGALLAAASGVGPNLVFLGLKVFPVAILGGLDSVGGALLAGLILGVLEALSQRYLEPLLPGFTEALPFVVVLLVLLVRPYGLLGERQIERA
ncbi:MULTISPECIES: branched-chain amino acid ABC transporter permease [Thermus]|uniref:Branched-chain amino acid ABC transporter permease n=1 Tax=Thermus scotoductus TaxID=37636 RepID=A0A430S3R4_THESC|nr:MULTISPECIES: branched-chain amino acid ABC transporter permease [Thermus]ETN88695.1 branched-chain amino acid ABC transporter permease [Thermus sp. NMX2.A1]RTG97712.1 branched-chain amino acid ABC transporter permease [Thermus scotoductus]RTH15418.1 branched-chain amino acid ABC transporter permease [Thermus scotoductus]RTH22276.1 branched-chain amino acid ABC transporter permease [Thermus scotoductus]RTH28464.1 branched-chain amino acid ABC transporter permease [Thermus scotoductus]